MSKKQTVRQTIFCVVAGTAAAFALTGCSDRFVDQGPVHYVTGGGPPPDAPTPIRDFSGKDVGYPNLAAVPPRPSDITPASQQQAAMDKLASERKANQDAADALRSRTAAPGAGPMAVPAPPALKSPSKPPR